MKPSFTSLSISFAALFALSGYNCNDVLQDPGFDLWCGDSLCAWELESGAIEQVPTWHGSDSGVSMLGDEVAFSQYADQHVSCLRFELIADVEETAEVTLQLDLDNDGAIEHEQRIPTSNWEQLSYLIDMPTTYRGILFRLHKRGSGRAILAEVAALSESSSECEGAPKIESLDGGWCNEASDCVSGICSQSSLFAAVCGMCGGDSDCSAGEACGLAAPDRAQYYLYRACVAEASLGLAERCVGDAECASGVCADGVCSACSNHGDCGEDELCTRREVSSLPDWSRPPRQCNPRGGVAASGEACLSDLDCVSGQCTGTDELRLCMADSRPCTEHADCPGDELGSSDEAGICATVGTAHGVCE